MAITLSAAVGFADGTLPVSADLPTSWQQAQPGVSVPPMILVDAELMLVRSSGAGTWLVTRGVEGTVPQAHASGAVVTPISRFAAPPNLGLTNCKGETMPRQTCPEVNTTVTTTGQIYLEGIYLTAGTPVNNLTFASATTAAGTPTHYCFALYTLGLALCATTADQTSTAWAANTVKTLATTATYVVPTSGFYYMAFMMVATTVATLKGGTARTDGTLSFTAPLLSGVSGTTYTTGTAPTTVFAIGAAVTTSIYGAVS